MQDALCRIAQGVNLIYHLHFCKILCITPPLPCYPISVKAANTTYLAFS